MFPMVGKQQQHQKAECKSPNKESAVVELPSEEAATDDERKRRQCSRMSAACQAAIPFDCMDGNAEKGTQTSPAPPTCAAGKQRPKRQLPRPRPQQLLEWQPSLPLHYHFHQQQKVEPHARPSKPINGGNGAEEAQQLVGPWDWSIGGSQGQLAARRQKSSPMLAATAARKADWRGSAIGALAFAALPGQSAAANIAAGRQIHQHQHRQHRSWDVPDEGVNHQQQQELGRLRGGLARSGQMLVMPGMAAKSQKRPLAPTYQPHQALATRRSQPPLRPRRPPPLSAQLSVGQQFRTAARHLTPMMGEHRQARSLDERPFVQQFGIRREKWPSVDDEATGTTTDGREWIRKGRQQRRDDFNGRSLRKGANRRPPNPLSSSPSLCFSPPVDNLLASSSASSSTTLPTVERPRVFSWRTPSRVQQQFRNGGSSTTGGSGSIVAPGTSSHFRLDRLDAFALSTPLRRDFAVDHRADTLFRTFTKSDPFKLL